MDKMLIIYGAAGLTMIVGLLSLYYSFRKHGVKQKMMKAMLPPPPKNYGNPFLLVFGVFCIVLAVLLLFKSRPG